MAAALFEILNTDPSGPLPRKYWDKQNYPVFEDYQNALDMSSTCYVGNLAFHTPEQLIYEFASQVGPVKQVIMGLNKSDLSPCGFAFVEFFSRSVCLAAEQLFSGQLLDNRIVKFQLDPGFLEGRQYGRGKAGNQIRDDFQVDLDRGGKGELIDAPPLTSRGPPPPPPPPPLMESTYHRSRQEHHHYHHDAKFKPRPERFNARRRSRDSRPSSSYAPPPPPPPLSNASRLKSHVQRVDEFGRDIVE